MCLIQVNAVLNNTNFCKTGLTADIVTVSLPDTHAKDTVLLLIRAELILHSFHPAEA